MAEDHAFQQRAEHLFLLGVEARGGLELEPQVLLGASFVLAEQQHICTHAESHGQSPDDVQGRLGSAALIAPQLHHVNADPIGLRLLGQGTLLSQRGQPRREIQGALRRSLHLSREPEDSHLEYRFLCPYQRGAALRAVSKGSCRPLLPPAPSGRTVPCQPAPPASAAIAANDAYGHSVSVASSTATNYAAPDALTPNGNSNLSTSYTYNVFLGVTSVTGPNQANSTIAYDTYGRPSSSTSPHGAVTTYAYAYSPSTVTATTGTRVVKTTLDGLGRTIKVETGDTTSVQSVVETEYDSCACSPLGKLKRVSLPRAPGATAYWTTYVYDALGRTVSVTAPDGSVTGYTYEGNCTKITDPAGKWKKHTTDALGNLVQVSELGGHETYYTSLLSKLAP